MLKRALVAVALIAASSLSYAGPAVQPSTLSSASQDSVDTYNYQSDIGVENYEWKAPVATSVPHKVFVSAVDAPDDYQYQSMVGFKNYDGTDDASTSK